MKLKKQHAKDVLLRAWDDGHYGDGILVTTPGGHHHIVGPVTLYELLELVTDGSERSQ